MTKQNGTKQTSQQAYQEAMSDISNLMGWLVCELEKTPDTIQWPHVGTLNKIRTDLLEILAFKSGFEIDRLKEALEESRLS